MENMKSAFYPCTGAKFRGLFFSYGGAKMKMNSRRIISSCHPGWAFSGLVVVLQLIHIVQPHDDKGFSHLLTTASHHVASLQGPPSNLSQPIIPLFHQNAFCYLVTKRLFSSGRVLLKYLCYPPSERLLRRLLDVPCPPKGRSSSGVSKAAPSIAVTTRSDN